MSPVPASMACGWASARSPCGARRRCALRHEHAATYGTLSAHPPCPCVTGIPKWAPETGGSRLLTERLCLPQHNRDNAASHTGMQPAAMPAAPPPLPEAPPSRIVRCGRQNSAAAGLCLGRLLEQYNRHRPIGGFGWPSPARCSPLGILLEAVTTDELAAEAGLRVNLLLFSLCSHGITCICAVCWRR